MEEGGLLHLGTSRAVSPSGRTVCAEMLGMVALRHLVGAQAVTEIRVGGWDVRAENKLQLLRGLPGATLRSAGQGVSSQLGCDHIQLMQTSLNLPSLGAFEGSVS